MFIHYLNSNGYWFITYPSNELNFNLIVGECSWMIPGTMEDD